MRSSRAALRPRATLMAVGGPTDRRTTFRAREGAVASPRPTRVGGGLARSLLSTSVAAAGAGGSSLIGRIWG